MPVLRGVSMRVEAGEFVAVMGPSGSGKSTLLHLMGALDVPTSGSIQIGGCELEQLSDRDRSFLRRNRIGFVFQFFNLLPTLTAAENVALPLLLAGENRTQHPPSGALGSGADEPFKPSGAFTRGAFRRRNAARGGRPCHYCRTRAGLMR